MANRNNPYRPDIDGLRAVSIVAVVIYHAFPSAMPGGFVGVDIFFVISGFLISGIIFRGFNNGDFSFVDFFARRVRRIFPALAIVLLSSFSVGWFVLLPHEFKQLGKHIAASAGFAQNFVLWKENGYFDISANLKPLLHLWSLAIEEQFYLLYPALMFLFWRARLIALVAIFSLSFGIGIWNASHDPVGAFFLPHNRIWELLSGSLLAYVELFKKDQVAARLRRIVFGIVQFFRLPVDDGKATLPNHLLSLVGAILIPVSVWLISKDRSFPGFWAAIPVAAALLLIHAGPDAWVNRVVLANKYVAFIGLISYPLYLWHWTVLSFVRILKPEGPTTLALLAAISSSVLLAWVTYQLLEKPIRFRNRTWIATASLVTTVVTVGYVGFGAFYRDGLPFRFPPQIMQYASMTYEQMMEDYFRDARRESCWLQSSQPYDGFANDCIERPRPGEGGSVWVWGDSHAARLFPGFQKIAQNKIALSQLTRDNCPPVLGDGAAYENCLKSNDYVLSRIKEVMPDTVILYGVWNSYQKDWRVDSSTKRGLLLSVRELRKAGIKNLIVVGPPPHFLINMLSLMFYGWRESIPHRVPERLSRYLAPDPISVDAELEEALKEEDVKYFSVLQALCNERGCMTLVPGSEPQQPWSWDSSHLTTTGAAFVAQLLLLSLQHPVQKNFPESISQEQRLELSNPASASSDSSKRR